MSTPERERERASEKDRESDVYPPERKSGRERERGGRGARRRDAGSVREAGREGALPIFNLLISQVLPFPMKTG